ncbi:hypothetical protein [Agrobacterium tumefaciens]|uniref:Uncharacterized protein n=1 Tax=Agrobacterium tumefaciens TaxID=358 RepID=A0A2L2LMH5_AGRTU|nr:hypothetical protein [Agrobacterium tumefaciens]AVH45529.1 hypothetical protein At1D1609_54980 [Agrobacterium tumefaciens]NSY99254.1 hypothetical protein [Agrobacterium tumefaciens]
MSNTRNHLRKYIRYQLEQMSAANEQHRFEDLSLELARVRIASNVIRATGPVQSGGDQGRDFETFTTYLKRSPISSSTFVARATDDVIAFACTLNKQITTKIRTDLKTIHGGGEKPSRVVYFCTPDVPVATRHRIQKEALSKHGSPIDIHDGQSIADMLCDADTFWIAEEYLAVPAELFPPVVLDSEYENLRLRWLEKNKVPYNRADFAEIKRGLRRATFDEAARPEINRWIELMRNSAVPGMERKAIYEVAVAQLRGKGTLDPEREEIGRYFASVPDKVGIESLEDLVNLASYASTANKLGQFQEEPEKVASWLEVAASAISTALEQEVLSSRRYRLLLTSGHLRITNFQRTGAEGAIEGCLKDWMSAAEIAQKDPLCDISTIADLLSMMAAFLADDEAYHRLVALSDKITASREGETAAANRARDRALALKRAGKTVQAIDQLQRAKDGWFKAETLTAATASMMLLAAFYLELHLPQAARYHAMMAMVTALRADRPETMGRTLAEAGFAVADSYYLSGEALTFLGCVGAVLPIYHNYTAETDDLSQHESVARAAAHAGVITAISPHIAPEIVPEAKRLIDSWMLEQDQLDHINTAGTRMPWATAGKAIILKQLSEEIGQSIANDLRDPVSISWRALGIRWSITAPDHLRADADAFAAMLQITQADLANVDPLIIPSNAEIRLQSGSRWHMEQIPDNYNLLWIVEVPSIVKASQQTAITKTAEYSAALVMTALHQASALPTANFESILKTRLEGGLLNRIAFVRPAREMMKDAREMATKSNPLPTIELAESIHVEPLESTELKPIGSAKLYSREQSLEMIGNRYRRLGDFASRIAPRINSSPQAKAVLQVMHDQGVRDWEILVILFNTAMQRHLGPLNETLRRNSERAVQKIMQDAHKAVLADPNPAFDASDLLSETWEMQKFVTVMAMSQSWGLEIHRATPDISAVRQLLVERFHHQEDDIDHPDYFGWNNTATDAAPS